MAFKRSAVRFRLSPPIVLEFMTYKVWPSKDLTKRQMLACSLGFGENKERATTLSGRAHRHFVTNMSVTRFVSAWISAQFCAPEG